MAKKKNNPKIDEDRLYELYEKMLKAQVKGSDFPLTFSEIQEVWGYASSSKAMATRYLPLMEQRGYVKSKQGTKGKHYLAVPGVPRYRGE